MEKSIRSQFWTLVWIAVICLSLMILALPRLSDPPYRFPLLVIVLGDWLFAFLITLIVQYKNLRQSLSNLRIEPACLSLAIIFFVSSIAIVFSPATHLGANWSVSIGMGQLLVMFLGILAAIVRLEGIHTRGQDEEVNKALALQRVTSTRMRRAKSARLTTHNRLWFPFRKSKSTAESEAITGDQPLVSPTEETAIASEKRKSIEEQAEPAITETAKTDASKSVQELPAEIRRLPSVHQSKSANKPTDPNRKQSSTMTKLQALSASGIGTVHHQPIMPSEIAPPPTADKPAEPKLKTVLNRLGTTNTPSTEEQSSTPAKNIAPLASQPSIPASPLFEQPVDKDMDDLFAKIIPEEAQRDVASKNVIPPAPIEAPAIEESFKSEIVSATPASAEPKLFKNKVDDQIEELFSGIAPAQAQREVGDVSSRKTTASNSPTANTHTEGVARQEEIAHELKDFGRLSAKASETASSQTLGTMKTIGKLLIDAQDVDNIIKKAEAGNITINLPSARVISADRGEGIQSLLEGIDNYQGVSGSMLVGEDGLVIACTYTGGDRDSLGVLAHGLLGNTNLAMLRLDLGQLEQMIFTSGSETDEGTTAVTTILTNVEVGALAVFVDSPLIISLDELLEELNMVARG